MHQISTIVTIMGMAMGSVAIAQDYQTDPINPAQCRAKSFIKTYIGSGQENPVRYNCTYTCKDNQSVETDIKITHTFYRKDELTEMTGMVCDGVIIKVDRKDGMLLGRLDSIKSFWALLSDRPEIREWATKHNVTLPAEVQAQLQAEMQRSLRVVAIAFLQVSSGFPQFEEAGTVLLEIAADTERGRIHLKKYLDLISKGTAPGSKADELIFSNLRTHAKFLIR